MYNKENQYNKSRLVALRYEHKQRVEYFESHSHVLSDTSIHIIFMIRIHLGHDMVSMDVKSLFQLDHVEEIILVFPKGSMRVLNEKQQQISFLH